MKPTRFTSDLLNVIQTRKETIRENTQKLNVYVCGDDEKLNGEETLHRKCITTKQFAMELWTINIAVKFPTLEKIF